MTGDILKALVACLSCRDGAETVAAAVGPLGWNAVFRAADDLRLAPALVARLRDKHAVPAIPSLVLPSGAATVTAHMERVWHDHLERDRILEARLVELASAMNAAGIEPVLLKGARRFATGHPSWRTMRDLDLLLSGRDAARAHEVALGLGYRPAETSREKAGKHHLQPLFRDDLPGWLEIHRKAAPHRAEALLPSRVLETMTVAASIGPARVRILATPAHALHGVVHHHVGHRGDKGGGIDLKGLFEFAADLMSLTGPERDEMLALARRHPRLLAALDLWIAAADAAFGVPIVSPFDVYPDAAARAARAIERGGQPQARYAGVVEEIGFANDRTRLLRLPGGDSAPGRLALRTRTLSSMLRPMIDPFGRSQPDQ